MEVIRTVLFDGDLARMRREAVAVHRALAVVREAEQVLR